MNTPYNIPIKQSVRIASLGRKCIPLSLAFRTECVLLALFLAGILFSSCDFEEKNINPNNSTTIEPAPLLTYSQLYTSNEGLSKRVQVGYCMMMVQQTASLDREEMAGDKYLETEMLGVYFTDTYASTIKNIQELINRTADNPEFVNTYAIALIWKSFLFHRITDLYGDVPYSEAGNGYETQIFYPKYDRQQDIYAGLIHDIETGLSLLDPAAPAIAGDIIYSGNIDRWKKFGNSLLLRLGMRMEHADAGLARSTVAKAVQGGVMQEPSDICMVRHVAGKSSTENTLSSVFRSHGLLNSGAVKISKIFMDRLKITNDPRLPVYCALPDGTTDIDKQKGLQNGYDVLTIYDGDPSFQSLRDYSTFNPATILLMDAPVVHLTPAEVELLQAEAVLKGWINGDAKTHYEKAVRLSMEQQAIYGAGGIIPEEQIDAYLAQNLFDKAPTTETKLNLIGTEFWVATFLNGYESYANWRRTGYPQLFPTSYSGSPNKGKIPRRFTYPTEEYSINLEHVEEANANQGADALSTRIWWDNM
ncbi:MAG: SusD/RagB family nutrient-binding outer membrane lipoprotein [Tannerella sp.]|jgi:hypothetical protein|nr:SusD/RagB family nutrient-binding outer membrane lipoprotein [Tannerella sp.]